MEKLVPTTRLEAFSDGVIAIIITIMVFDLKFAHSPTAETLGEEMVVLWPRLLSYVLSFLVLAIMWVNHHQLFHQIKHTDRRLLWYNILLLFCMSLIPFVTHFAGTSPNLPQAAIAYGLVFFSCALSFTLMRHYASGKANLLHETISRRAMIRARRKNLLGMGLYMGGAVLSMVSVYISWILFLVVPVMYFMPDRIIHEQHNREDGA